MYNKKYCLEKIEEFGRHNYIYDDVEGSLAYPAYFNVGERGWFLYIENVWYESQEFAHRIHTSVVNNVEYTEYGNIIVTTQNTKFTFVLVNQ